MRKWIGLLLSFLLTISTGCQMNQAQFTGAANEVKLVTLDPGHFHAALVQKTMYPQVDPTVYVYAPEGPDVIDHLQRIEGFNTRPDNPTRWNEEVYTGPDYLEKMVVERKGNVVVISGNNLKKTDYIHRSVLAGFNVLADKPMVISPEEFPLLVRSFQDAKWRGLLLYDIMTERYEITAILQRELSQIPEVFGRLQTGTLENPAVTMESVHHFFKSVAGNPLQRPAWFFDTNQQGQGLVDVTVHLVDLIQWECFPEQVLHYKRDIKILNAKRWPTLLTPEQFSEVTGLNSYPDYLRGSVRGDRLEVYSNGEINYTIKGVHARVSVTWNYQAPEGTGDTHDSVMRGTRANLIIRQDAEENYKPTLYVEANGGAHIDNVLHRAVYRTLQQTCPGMTMTFLEDGKWRINIPDTCRVGHEARFARVMKKYLRYLADGKLPAWEVPNMIAKYYTTTQALKAAEQ